MIVAGCDLGSATGKVVIMDEDKVLSQSVVPANFSPEMTAMEAMTEALALAGISSMEEIKYMVGTGYGRADVHFVDENLSEISCHAYGVHWLNPRARTVIDVGGQDCKVISIDESGKVLDFAMNDKCAAGTGKFFEAMARALRCKLEELATLACQSNTPAAITRQCSVFAESEVVTLLNSGTNRTDIAAGIHISIAGRLHSMLNRVGIIPEIAFTGGCAKNEALRQALTKKIGLSLTPLRMDPQLAGALGAALLARQRAGKAPENVRRKMNASGSPQPSEGPSPCECQTLPRV